MFKYQKSNIYQFYVIFLYNYNFNINNSQSTIFLTCQVEYEFGIFKLYFVRAKHVFFFKIKHVKEISMEK